MENILIKLAEYHYELGFIGLDEYRERVDVALWLSDKLDGADPRVESPEKEINGSCENFESGNEAVVLKNAPVKNGATGNEDDWLEFLCLNT